MIKESTAAQTIARHWAKKGEPPCLAKYAILTDSAQVPWGKGEKEPYAGSEKDTEPRRLQSVEGYVYWLTNGLPFA